MRSTLRPLAALAMVALLSAGCSNAAAQTGTGSNAAANREQTMKFADCMRKNGVRAFPDPNASGELTIDGIANGSSLDTDSAVFKQALTACKDLQPSGFMGHKRSPQEQEAALKFAQCVRENGVKDFPDPTPDGPLIDTSRIPSVERAGVPPRSNPVFNAALQKCGDFLSGAGVRAR
jgi:hypothetical protein